MQRRLSAVIFVFCWACALALSAPPAHLAATLNARLQDAALHGARIGVLVQSLDDGSTWYAHNADRLFVPASNAKILTAIMALDYLKPEFRFATRVLTDGQVTDGILHGNLYLQGAGDPSLRQVDLHEMARTLAVGDPAQHLPPIKKVSGRLVLDESFFPTQGPLLNADGNTGDLPWDYAAPSSALSCEDNAVTINVLGTTPGKPPTVTETPETDIFTIQNQAVTAVTSAAADATPVQLAPQGDLVRISGLVAPGKLVQVRICVPHPSHFTEELFRRELRREGITVGETATGMCDPHKDLLLCDHRSEPLSKLLVTMLKNSNNYYAEQLRWTLLALYSREKPLNVRYQCMLQDFCAHSGLHLQGIWLVDGSGLSRDNRVTPDAMVRVLTFMTHSPNFDLFYHALPVAGVDGTLKHRMTCGPATCNVHAKTGTLRGVSALSGYFSDVNGERLVFSIFVNNCTSVAMARQLQDDIVSRLARCSDKCPLPAPSAQPAPSPPTQPSPAVTPPPTLTPPATPTPPAEQQAPTDDSPQAIPPDQDPSMVPETVPQY